MARGTLRIFLGAAPGVGKTYEMLEEAHRLGKRGEDVVVAFALDHGRSETRALLDGLEVIPPRRLPYRGTEFEEMDLDAVLARAPGTAVVDEYAHSNIPGSRHAETLGGRRCTPQRRHQRPLHRQHPASGVPRRRRQRHHRRPPGRDGAGRRRAAGRPDPPGRHFPGTAPPAPGRRQDLRRRQDRRRPLQLFPPGQPHRTARTGPAVAGRPGR